MAFEAIVDLFFSKNIVKCLKDNIDLCLVDEFVVHGSFRVLISFVRTRKCKDIKSKTIS